MDDAELSRLLADLESDRSERTRAANDTDKLGEAICAFANDLPGHRAPGYLFVGATPDGKASGLPVTDELLQKLAAIRSDGNLLPPPRMTVVKRDLGGGTMAVVEVHPSELPPVRYKGTVWVRVGPRRARATEADERALAERRAALARTWDAQPCAEATLDDLVLPLFESYRAYAVSKEVLDENHRPLVEQLSSLRFFDRTAARPTNAAVLLFGKDPVYFAPGAYVQFVAYEGADAGSAVLKEREYSGDLLSVLRGLDELAKDLSNPRLEAETALTERTVYDYPPAALREVLVNAVIHRDYASTMPVRIDAFEDRIEVVNPGGLYDLRPEDLGRGPTGYRNPVLAEAAKTLGFVNRFGRGLPRIRAAMTANGSEPPRFEPTERHFLVVLGRRR